MSDLSGKTVLMLGGVHALSAGVAQRFADAGASVIHGHERGLTLDDPDALTGQIAALGPLHVAVISPGWFAFDPFLETSAADWDAALARNFEQATYAAQAAARHLIAQGNGGRIIFLSAVGALKSLARTSAVGTSLSALHVIARMVAVDLGPHRITVNVVVPGWIEAEWYADFLTPDGRTYVQQGIPVGRIGAPADVGDVCCFLASEQAAYVTGAIIPVDGGYTLTKADGETPYPAKR